MGDPDLSAGQGGPQEREAQPRSALAGRGLVVFPAPARAGHQALLVRYAPFLVTVTLGALVVVAVALVR